MNKILKISVSIFFSLFLAANFALVVYAQVSTDYRPLTTVPGAFKAGELTNPVEVIAGAYGLAIGIGSVIAVIMIILAGFKYMYQESIEGKSNARQQIENAFIGLLVILGSYILLRTINPALVNFDVTLQGGRGTVASLTAITKRLDAANTNAAMAISNISALDKQITDLKKQVSDIQASTAQEIAVLQGKASDIQTAIDEKNSMTHTTTEEDVQIEKDIADLQAQLRAVNKQIADKSQGVLDPAVQAQLKSLNQEISDKTVSKFMYQTTADQQQVIAKIDKNLTDLAPGGSSNNEAISADINNSQAGVKGLFERTLAQLATLDQSDPNVKQAILNTEAIRDSMDAEFKEQRLINIAYNGYSFIQNIGDRNIYDNTRNTLVQTIQSDITTYTQRLKATGLTNEAAAFAQRANDRLVVICNQAKLCAK